MTDHFQQACDLIAEHRHEEALSAFDRALEEGPRAAVLGHRAYLLRGMGRYADSLADYNELLAADPENMEAATNRAEVLGLAGRFHDAMQAAQALIALDSANYRAARLLVRCHEALAIAPLPAWTPPTPGLQVPWSARNPAIEIFERDRVGFPESVHHEIGRFLYAFVRMLRPAVAVETGCFAGYSTMCIAQAMKDNGGGHLHSFDLFVERANYVSPILGPAPDMWKAAHAHIAHAGLERYVTFYRGDSSQRMTDVLGAGKLDVDFAFIDGDHSVSGCLADWRAVDPHLRAGGVAALHDTTSDEAQWLGPEYLMRELAARAPENFQVINLPTMDRIGVGLIQKTRMGVAPDWTPRLTELLVNLLQTRGFWRGLKKRDPEGYRFAKK